MPMIPKNSEITLGFPVNNGAEEEGLNDPGIETFEGDIDHYIARECGQNTLDAADGADVRLSFDLLHLELEQLPCLKNLDETFDRCLDYWKSDNKAVAFFKSAKEWLKKSEIPVLKISDYGTSGLTGEDTDRNSRWYGLVRSKGACNKGEGAGGSFGIGKYSAFAASALRTVYYYTKTKDGHAFQGVSRLVTHYTDDGNQVHPTGYIGFCFEENGRIRYASVRDKSLIPSHFLRHDSEQTGTDIYIPAFRASQNWQERLIISILNNFWPALCLKRIVFHIADVRISADNIDQFMEKYKNNEDLNAYRYFNAYRKGTKFSKTLDHIGSSNLWLIVDAERKSNPIAVSRRNGMIIELWGRFTSRKPLSGVFICDDSQGNEILRRLEPPRHDKWDPARGENGKAVLKSIRKWIQECIENFLPLYSSDSFAIDAISKYLPDDSEEREIQESFDENVSPDAPRGFDSFPKQPEKDITKSVIDPISDSGKEQEIKTPSDDEQTEEESGGGAEGKGGGGKGERRGVGPNVGKGHGGSGGAYDSVSSTKVLSLRSIYQENDQSYLMIIRAEKKFEGTISFSAECDDGGTEPLFIKKVTNGENSVEICGGGRAFSASIDAGERRTFKVHFTEPHKFSISIV